MKLYTFDAAPNPRRLNLFIAHKGIKLPTQQVDLRSGQQFSAEFTAICPRCIVPVLQLDDGSVLCDGIAICWYLETCYPQRPLMGTEPLQQAQILSWDHYVYTEGFLPVAEILRNRSEAFKDKAVTGPDPVSQIPELESRGRQRLRSFWRRLDEHMEGRNFVVGNSMTLADIDIFVVVDFAGWVKERVPQTCPQVQAWHQRIESLLAANQGAVKPAGHS